MRKDARIYVSGPETFLGSALVRVLRQNGFTRILEEPSGKLNLTDAREVDQFFERHRPEFVFVAAGKTGGIIGNANHPAELGRENLLIACHVLESAHRYGVSKLLFLASSCCYPKHASSPMREEALLTGPWEPTSEAYAAAKIAGIKLCQAYRRQYNAPFISAIPANLFGPGDDFHPENSHVVAALIRKMHEARESGAGSVEIWGTGTPRREFVYVDDLADACLFVMEHYDGSEPINLGGGTDLSIRELAEAVKKVVGFGGTLKFNSERPDGMPLKLLDGTKLKQLGWKPKFDFYPSLKKTYEWFLKNEEKTGEKRYARTSTISH